jgi:adenylate kinase
MRLILVGPPGSGKGTQAKKLSERLCLCHIGTGDLLREAVRHGTPAGVRARPFMSAGKLVPDDLVNEIVKDLFTAKRRPEKFVTDGYPRTVAQAASFDQVLRQQFLTLDAVVQLVVADDEIVRRTSVRWSCPHCNSPYHMVAMPPKVPGKCDYDGFDLIQREDDKEETVRKRLQIFHENTEPLLAHYEAQGLLRKVAGVGDVEEIYNKIVQAVPVTDARR